MLANLQKFTALRSDLTDLVTSLRLLAGRNELRKHSDTGPLERGMAMAHADALMLAAEKLDALLAKHPA